MSDLDAAIEQLVTANRIVAHKHVTPEDIFPQGIMTDVVV